MPKNEARIEAYGNVNELNSHIGLLCASMHAKPGEEEVPFLHSVQNRLFKIGTRLATPTELWAKMAPRYTMTQDDVDMLEQAIDRMTVLLPPKDAFILPGGNTRGARAHVCCTVCRRTERRILTLQDQAGPLEKELMAFINRLSDYLFVLARYLNNLTHDEEILWSGV